MGPLKWVGQKCCNVKDVKLGHVAVLSLRLSAFLHAVFLKSLKQTPKIKTVCTYSPQPRGRCRSIRSATKTDTKTRTENIRKHFSFIKDSHVGNWNNVNNYTRFIPRETNNSGTIQSEVGLLEKKEPHTLLTSIDEPVSSDLAGTHFFLLRGDYELTVHHQGF